MKIILFLPFLLLFNCATTEIYGTDGRPLFRTQADMTKAEYNKASDGSIAFKADTIDHSKPTMAGGKAYSAGVVATGTAIATSGIPSLIK